MDPPIPLSNNQYYQETESQAENQDKRINTDIYQAEAPIDLMIKKLSSLGAKKIDLIFAGVILLVLAFTLFKGIENNYTIVGLWKPIDHQQELMNLYYKEDGEMYFFQEGYELYSEALHDLLI